MLRTDHVTGTGDNPDGEVADRSAPDSDGGVPATNGPFAPAILDGNVGLDSQQSGDVPPLSTSPKNSSVTGTNPSATNTTWNNVIHESDWGPNNFTWFGSTDQIATLN